MPSRYEPCGLGQLISLRYGTIPIVRETGGLKDTITDYDPETRHGNGFLSGITTALPFSLPSDEALQSTTMSRSGENLSKTP